MSVEGPLDALKGLEGFDLVIQPDGSVTFIDFPPEMLDVALALNPDDPLVCERLTLLRATSTTEDDVPERRQPSEITDVFGEERD